MSYVNKNTIFYLNINQVMREKEEKKRDREKGDKEKKRDREKGDKGKKRERRDRRTKKIKYTLDAA
jgi:hypothetical protein